MLTLNFIDILFSLSLFIINTTYLLNRYLNNNTTLNTISIYLFDTIFLLIYVIIEQRLIIYFFDDSYIFVIFLLLLVILLFILISVFWQETTRLLLLTTWIVQAYPNNIVKLGVFKQKPIQHEYFFIMGLLIPLFIVLNTQVSSLNLYVVFELLSLLVLVLLGFQITKDTIKATIVYFFYSFYSTLFLLWGLTLLYTNLNFDLLNLNILYWGNLTNLTWHLSFIFITFSFFIKLGIFPYHFWVNEVYVRLSNLNHIVLLSLVNVGYFFSMLNILQSYSQHIQNTITLSIIVFILNVGSIGSTFFGALLLYYQNNFKGVFAANSIITFGFLLLALNSFLSLTIFSNKYTLLWFIVLYLFFYNNSLYIAYNIWHSFLLWIEQNNYVYAENLNLERAKLEHLSLLHWVADLSGYDDLTFFNNSGKTLDLNKKQKFTILQQIIHNFFIYAVSVLIPWLQKCIIKWIALIEIIQIKLSVKQGLNSIAWNSNNLNIFYLGGFRWVLTYYYQDYCYYVLLWILFGFPPFLLFILKFYIYLFILKAGFVGTALIVSLLTNIFFTGAVCRIFTLITFHITHTSKINV